MSSSCGPLKTRRLVTLGLAWCFSVISSCVGLNALLKSSQDKSRFKKLAPFPAVVYIDTSDISGAGIAATTASLLISILIFHYIAAIILPFTRTREWSRSKRALRLQSYTLFFGCAFLLVSMIPYMVFFVNREAGVTAFIGTTQLPDAAIKAVEKASGSTSVYRKIHYLKLLAILPWFSLAFTLGAAAVLFMAGRDSTGTSTEQGTHAPPEAVRTSSLEMEKEDKASVV